MNKIDRLLMKLKIEQKLFWPLAAGAVIIVALFVYLTAWYAGNIIEQETIKQGNTVSVLITKKIAEEYTRVADASDKMSRDVEDNYDKRAMLHEIAAELLNRHAQIDGVTIDININESGTSDNIWLYAYKQYDRILFAESRGQLKPSNYCFSAVRGWNSHYLDGYDADRERLEVETYTTVFAKKRHSGEIHGTICVSTAVDWNRKITMSYLAEMGSHGFYLSKAGDVLHVTPPELRDKYVCDFHQAFDKASKSDDIFRNAVDKMKAGKEDIVLVSDPVNGEPVWMSYSPLFDNWSFAVFISDAGVQKQIRLVILKIAAFGIAAFWILLLWIKIVAKSIARPIRALDAASSEIAAGNFAASIPAFEGGDEVSRLSGTLRKMVHTINDHVDKERADAVAKERVDSQLRVAAEIQMNLLPTDYSQIKKIGKIDIFAYLKPAWEVGGDLYNFINIDGRHVFFMIGDVADKGVPAAIYMTRTYSFLKVFKDELYSPGEVLNRLNGLLAEGNGNCMFATAFCAVLDTHTGRLRYASAGHVPPVLMTATGKCRYLKPKKNCPVGFMANRKYEEEELQLASGDGVFLYTDGVNEARSSGKELFGYERLLETLEEVKNQECHRVLFDLQQRIDDYTNGCEQSDDIAMLMVRLTEN